MTEYYSAAKIGLPKTGPKIYMRVCKAGQKCRYCCEHRKPHMVSIKCSIKCCDVIGKDVRCVPIEE